MSVPTPGALQLKRHLAQGSQTGILVLPFLDNDDLFLAVHHLGSASGCETAPVISVHYTFICLQLLKMQLELL